MALEDVSSYVSVRFVRSIERIEEDGCLPNREVEDDDDKKIPWCHYIEPW